MFGSQKKLGEILIKKGLLTLEQLNTALLEQKKTKEFLGAILLKMKWIKEKDLLEALSEQFNIPTDTLENKYIDWNLLKHFSSSLILDQRCFPIRKDDWSVTVAITNPLDAWALKKAEEEAMPLHLKLILVPENSMREAVLRYQQYMRANISKFFK